MPRIFSPRTSTQPAAGAERVVFPTRTVEGDRRVGSIGLQTVIERQDQPPLDGAMPPLRQQPQIGHGHGLVVTANL